MAAIADSLEGESAMEKLFQEDRAQRFDFALSPENISLEKHVYLVVITFELTLM